MLQQIKGKRFILSSFFQNVHKISFDRSYFPINGRLKINFKTPSSPHCPSPKLEIWNAKVKVAFHSKVLESFTFYTFDNSSLKSCRWDKNCFFFFWNGESFYHMFYVGESSSLADTLHDVIGQVLSVFRSVRPVFKSTWVSKKFFLPFRGVVVKWSKWVSKNVSFNNITRKKIKLFCLGEKRGSKVLRLWSFLFHFFLLSVPLMSFLTSLTKSDFLDEVMF